MRDSVFGLLKKNILWSDYTRMTLRSCSFLPLLVGLYAFSHVNLISPWMLLIFLPVFSRAPIQLACRYLPLPTEAPKKGNKINSFFVGKAEVYELLWNLVIGSSMMGIISGGG
jgi:hypothetical protein